jgi:hypothetical protein
MLVLHTSDTIDDVRARFFQINSLKEADLFIDKLQYDTSAEARGYMAAMNFTKSRLYKFPLKKLKYFNRGKSILEEVIDAYPLNIELRYLRYSMQKKIPDFLGYNRNIDEDLVMIKKKIASSRMSIKIKSIILNNILILNELNEKDKFEFENILNQL